MKNISTLILIISGFIRCQAQDIPEWLQHEWKYLTNGNGIWTTSNAVYKSTSEPFDQYGLEWKYDLGNACIVGKLYGIIERKKIQNFGYSSCIEMELKTKEKLFR